MTKQPSGLAQEAGDTFARMLTASMPRIQQAMKESGRQASFTVTAQFRSNREGEIELDLKPRERIPLETQTMKLTWKGEQLELAF